jgi:plasmid stabilization system protein ParE
MRIEFSNRAVSDLRNISSESRRAFGERVAENLELRIRAAIVRIGKNPLGAPDVKQRPGVHVLSLVRYPFRIFYRVHTNHILIQHVRHTARRPEGER